MDPVTLIFLALGVILTYAIWMTNKWLALRVPSPGGSQAGDQIRNGRSDYVYLPVEDLLQLGNPDRFRQIRRHKQDHLEDVRDDLDEGIREPLTVLIDTNGKVALKDGHHRVMLAIERGRTHLPVVFKESQRIRSHGVAASTIVPDLLRNAQAAQLAELTNIGVRPPKKKPATQPKYQGAGWDLVDTTPPPKAQAPPSPPPTAPSRTRRWCPTCGEARTGAVLTMNCKDTFHR